MIDFDPLEADHGWYSQIGPSYEEDGFELTVGADEYSGFGVWGSESVGYQGSTALFNDAPNGVVTLQRIGGGSFSFDSIDLAGLYSTGAASITFDAILAIGGTASQTFQLDALAGFESFTFSDLFNDVLSVSWLQSAPYHQFDNIGLDSGVSDVAPVPLPASLPLLAGALGAVALVRRRARAA